MRDEQRDEGSTAVELTYWLVHRLHPFAAYDVGAVIPTGYAAYARIMHPASRSAGGAEITVRWADVAAWSGRIVHPQMQFAAISRAHSSRADPVPWDGDPLTGSLTAQEAIALRQVLAGFTGTPDCCVFCLWEGYGWVSGMETVTEVTRGGSLMWPVRAAPPPALRAGPRWPTPARAYHLYRGPLTAVTAFCGYLLLQTPNVWWPDDRAWCVASEVDLTCTYVGGERNLVAQVLADPRLEALPAQFTDSITIESDLLNTTVGS